MKKPLSIRGNVKVLSSTVYPYQKIRTVFSLLSVIHEFFQKKLNYIKATKFFLYNPLTKRFVRLTAGGIFDRRDYTVLKKDYPWSDYFEKLPEGSNSSWKKKVFYIRSRLKNRILVQVQGGTEFQSADILKYFEELKRGPNTEIGTKDFF
jgi:hypothetical protein